MIIKLDLDKSINNYERESKKELADFINNDILTTLWELYKKDILTTEEQNRLYDILDFFTRYTIESGE